MPPRDRQFTPASKLLASHSRSDRRACGFVLTLNPEIAPKSDALLKARHASALDSLSFLWEGHMALSRYDPHEHVNPGAWLELDESERMQLVRRYHRRQRIRLPNETIHAVVHVIVENQVALGDAFPARAVLLRLMEEGLDRHEAAHAIGWVLSERLFAALREEGGADLNTQYVEKLNRLTAESWRKQAS
jgi:Domain of unknown function (DUF1841)